MKVPISYIELLVLPLLTISLVYLYSTRELKLVEESRTLTFEKSNRSVLDVEAEEVSKVSTGIPSDIQIGGWIPDWDMIDGLASVQNQQNLDYISPVWFTMTEDERLKENSYANGPGIFEEVRERNLKLIPSILQLNVNYLSDRIKDQRSIDRHIENILGYVDEYNYDGIDLDYETIYLKDKKKFYSFLEQLSNELHSRGKILSMSVLPIWYESVGNPSSPQSRKVQDYNTISSYLDEVRLMTYELFYSKAQVAGPVAPIDWLEATVQYAILAGIPREKILLGIPTYSYDWSDRELAGDEIEFNNFLEAYLRSTDLEGGVPLYNNSINKIKEGYPYTESYNISWEEMVLKYHFREQDRVVVYPTQRSLDARKALAVKYGLKGVAYWRLGDEDGLIL